MVKRGRPGTPAILAAGAGGRWGRAMNPGDGDRLDTTASARSEARAQANRRNAKKSTGPRSQAGKAASSRNAVKHGLTALKVITDGEDSEEYGAKLAEWLGYYRPADPAQKAVIERAVYQTWRLERCARYEAAKTGERVRHAPGRYDYDQQTDAEKVGRRLIYEPIDRCRSPEIYHPVVRDRIQKRLDDNPALLTLELQQSAKGVDWLLERWAELAESLRFHGFWHYPEKFQAVRMLGKRPEDLIEDPDISRIFLACNAAHPETWDFWDEAFQAKLGLDSKPMYVLQVEDLKSLLPTTADDGVAGLRQIIDAEVARLRGLKSGGLDAIDRADRVGPVDRALFDESPAGALFHRYEAACDRALHTSIRDLLAIRECEAAMTPAESPNHTPPPTAESVTPPDPVHQKTPLRNEPTAEVVSQIGVEEGPRDTARGGGGPPPAPDPAPARSTPGDARPPENRGRIDPR